MNRRCAFCGAPFKAVRVDQTSCSTKCGSDLANLEMKRARRLYRALYGWRLRDDASKDDMRFCREIASWKEEDARAGRPRPPRHQHDLDRGHQVENPGGRPRRADGARAFV